MTSATNPSGVPEWTLGDRLRKAREVAGLTQDQLAQRIGISKRTVTAAEGGEHRVRKIVVNAWSLATGVPVQWLNGPENPRPGCERCAIRDSNPEPADYWPSLALFPLPGAPALPEWLTDRNPLEWIFTDPPKSPTLRVIGQG